MKKFKEKGSSYLFVLRMSDSFRTFFVAYRAAVVLMNGIYSNHSQSTKQNPSSAHLEHSVILSDEQNKMYYRQHC